MARRGFQLVDSREPKVYCEITDDAIRREGNTIHFTFNAILKAHHPTGKGFDSYDWQVDLSVNGQAHRNNVLVRRGTGTRVIDGIEYYMHSTSGHYNGSINVDPRATSIQVRVHFRRPNSNEGGDAYWHIPIPQATGPSGMNHRVHSIESEEAKIDVSISHPGHYAHLTKFQLEYGTNTSYGRNLEQHGQNWARTFSITNLEPSQIYYYRISSHNSLGFNTVQTGWFQTEPTKDIRVVEPDGDVKIPKVFIVRPNGQIRRLKEIKVVK